MTQVKYSSNCLDESSAGCESDNTYILTLNLNER